MANVEILLSSTATIVTAMETLAALIRRLRKTRGLTQGQVAKYARVSRSWMALVEAGKRRKPERDRLEQVARVLQVPPETLFAAAGYRVKPLPFPEEPSADDLLRRLQAKLAQDEQERRQKEREGWLVIPKGEQRISGGPGSYVAEYEYLPPDKELAKHIEHLRAYTVSGDCMAPRIEHGDTVIVDTQREWKTNDTVVAIHEGEAIVKKVEKGNGGFQLVAVQKRLPISVTSETEIRGVVIRVIKPV